MKIILGITGATGAPLAVRLLEFLRDLNIEVHLVISNWGKSTLSLETQTTYEQLINLATTHYDPRNLAAPIASGSFRMDGMIIAPCSMKTLASIRMGLSNTLITRAADVMLKEGKKLILVTRETPLNIIHLENMLFLARAGAIIFPPTPAFYHKPQNIQDILDHLAVRILDQLSLNHPNAKRWEPN